MYRTGLANRLSVQYKIRTHVQSPTQTFHTAIEAVRKVGVMLEVWMSISPNIDKLWSALGRIGSVKDLPKRFRFIQRVARSFIPI